LTPRLKTKQLQDSRQFFVTQGDFRQNGLIKNGTGQNVATETSQAETAHGQYGGNQKELL